MNRWNRFVLGERYINGISSKYPKSKAEKKLASSDFGLCATVHGCEQASLKPDIEPEHHFEVTLESDSCTAEKYALFEHYQQVVHHEGPGEVTKAGFQRFLCGSPLHRRTTLEGKKLGSFHHCYRLDGRLIAMSVIDLLPHAVSGVYFVYHHDFERWSFGKLSALREAALALEAGHQYYYMGYYIHSCLKMRYKGDYKPQYVLDLDRFGWDPLDDEMRTLMQKRKYVSMSQERARECPRPGASEVAPTAEDAKEEGKHTEEDDANFTYGEIKHPSPSKAASAANSGLSLLQLGMPGVTPLEQLLEQIDLGNIQVSLGRQGIHRVNDIVSWNKGSELEPHTIKGIVAEFAACAGPEVAADAVIDFWP